MDRRDKLAALDPEIVCAEGFDDCILGLAEGASIPMLAVYDTNKVIIKLSEDMTEEEAREFFEFNIVSAYVGERTPVFLTRLFDDGQSKEVSNPPEGES